MKIIPIGINSMNMTKLLLAAALAGSLSGVLQGCASEAGKSGDGSRCSDTQTPEECGQQAPAHRGRGY